MRKDLTGYLARKNGSGEVEQASCRGVDGEGEVKGEEKDYQSQY